MLPRGQTSAPALAGSKEQIRDRLAVWKEAAKQKRVDTLLLGTNQPEAIQVMAEEIL